jgi:hypothetical protein
LLLIAPLPGQIAEGVSKQLKIIERIEAGWARGRSSCQLF